MAAQGCEKDATPSRRGQGFAFPTRIRFFRCAFPVVAFQEVPMEATLFVIAAIVTGLLLIVVTRPRVDFGVAAAAAGLASILLLMSPTPDGYSEGLDSDRPGGHWMAQTGPRVAGMLFLVSAVCMTAGAMGRHRMGAPNAPE
jgi:hypothetical protein